MGLSADVLRKMREMGLTLDQVIELAEAIVSGSRDSRDETAERKREADRIRMRDKRAVARQSRDTSCDVVSDPLETKVSPTPPSKTQSPIPPSPPKGGSSPKGSADFDRFWLAYPRKTDKGEARKAYAKALAKVAGPDPPGTLLRALERVKPTWTDPRYIPHPSTWLNRERWEDEPETQIIPIRQAHERPHADHRKAQFTERLGDIDAAMGAAFGAVGRPGGS